MNQKNYPPPSLSWLVWGLGAAFYFTAFYHRVAPAVMTEQLMAEFHIGAASLGNFSAFYFYGYVLMQIPTGILADHWGPRKLLTAGAAVSACGTALFASAVSIIPADIGRFLIGGASGLAFVSLLRLATRWFNPRWYATVGGLAICCGVAGAVSAGVPLHVLAVLLGWRPVMFVAAGLTLFLGAAVWWVVRDDPARRGYRSFAPQAPETAFPLRALFGGLRTVLRYRNTWLLSLVAVGMTGPPLTFAGLWGVPFLTTLYGMSTATSSAITSTLMLCYAAGGLLLGILSDRIGRRKPIIACCAAINVLAWPPILFIPHLPLWLLLTLVTITGAASSAMIVGFAQIKESVPPHLAGTVSGVCNVGAMSGPMILQPAIGWVLDRHWPGVLIGGVRIYDLAAYRASFALIIAFACLSLLLVGFTTETSCRQTGAGESGDGRE
jgi:MFS family permease